MPVSQSQTLRLLTALRCARPAWGGALFLGIGLGETGRAVALASLAAGAAGIFLEDDPVELWQAQREGCCTFSVTTLDEALRALKNEIRQRRAITVALRGNVAVWLGDMVDRGLVPDAAAASHPLSDTEEYSAAQLQTWGTTMLGGCGLHAPAGAADLERMLEDKARGWWIEERSAATPAERRALDRAELASPVEDAEAAHASRAFLRTASALFPRSLERARWVRAQDGKLHEMPGQPGCVGEYGT